ncbi:hypothetical protein Ancab_028989 [Ancistrocladus abbreviatus]
MNIVKGVADLIRRTSGGHHAEATPSSQVERFTLPAHKIRFSEVGDECVLNSLWERYEKAVDKVERRRLFHVFLKQFLDVYKKWEPVDSEEDAVTSLCTVSTMEHSSPFGDVIVGCSAGHPTEFILVLAEEVTHLTSLVTELNTGVTQSTSDPLWASASLAITSEGLPLLNSITIVVRSVHNCRVFGYNGGVHKLIALIKAAVVQLKSISGALSVDEGLSNSSMDKIELLQKLLVLAVSIVCSFIDLNSNPYEMAQVYCDPLFHDQKNNASVVDSSSMFKVRLRETVLHWKPKAVVSVLEAGGLNWLVGKIESRVEGLNLLIASELLSTIDRSLVITARLVTIDPSLIFEKLELETPTLPSKHGSRL